MSKAERKHHEKRLKAKRSKYFMASGRTPKQQGKVYHTPALCSCPTCGNPRKHLRGKRGLTMQEKRAKAP